MLVLVCEAWMVDVMDDVINYSVGEVGLEKCLMYYDLCLDRNV